MNKSTREQEFLRPAPSVASISLRPLSSGSYALLAKTNNGFLRAVAEDKNKDDLIAYTLEYAFIHAAPLDLVLRAVYSSPEVFQGEVFRFSQSIPINELPAIIQEIEKGLRAAASQTVDVIPRGGSIDKDAPPNS